MGKICWIFWKFGRKLFEMVNVNSLYLDTDIQKVKRNLLYCVDLLSRLKNNEFKREMVDEGILYRVTALRKNINELYFEADSISKDMDLRDRENKENKEDILNG